MMEYVWMDRDRRYFISTASSLQDRKDYSRIRFSMVTSLNNELIAMISTGEFLYVLSLKVKHVLRLICGCQSGF